MTDIGDNQPVFGVKKFVVFEVCTHKCIGACANGFGNQETAGSSAHSNAAHVPAKESGMPYAWCVHGISHVLEKIAFSHGFAQIANKSGAHLFLSRFRRKNGCACQTQFFGDFRIHPTEINIIQVGMDGINSHLLSDCPDHRAFHITIAIKPFQTAKNNRMMRHYHIASSSDGLFDDLLRRVETKEDTGDGQIGTAHNEPRVVIRFLQMRGSHTFQKRCNVLYFNHFSEVNGITYESDDLFHHYFAVAVVTLQLFQSHIMINKPIFSFIVLVQLAVCLPFTLSAQADTSTFVRASFPGGERAFSLYWDRNFAPSWKFRANPPEGEGLLRFYVDEQGNVSNIQILKSLTPDLDKQALAAAAGMPRWQPAILDGKPVASSVETYYFLLIDRYGSKSVPWEEKEEQATRHGLAMDLWGGLMPHTGDFARYMGAIRGSLGIEFSYRNGPFSVGLGWDILAVSRVREYFQVNNLAANERFLAAPVYMYVPVRYTIESSSRWVFAPMLTPGVQYLEIHQRGIGGSGSNPVKVTDISAFTLGIGLHASKRVYVREYYNPVRNRPRYESTYIGMRLMLNRIGLNQPDSTPMKGTAITLAFSLSGWLQPFAKK